MTVLEQEVKESERAVLHKIEEVLNNEQRAPKLIGPYGEEIELPPSLFYILRQIVRHLLHGKAVTIIPLHQELTTQEAAEILNVSRPYFIKLLEEGAIPFVKVGKHRRVRLTDLIAYKQVRDDNRRQSLAELTQMSQDMGLYNE